MRILTLGTLYPPHDGGGGYEILWESAVRALRAAGHEVRVLATDHRVPGAGPDAGDVHRELRWYWRDHAFPRRPWREVVAIERHNARVLARHLADFRPDRVGYWPLGGLSLSLLEAVRRAGVPATAFVIDDWLDYGRRADPWHRTLSTWPELAGAAERLTGVPGAVDFAGAAHYAFVSEATRHHAFLAGVPTPDASIVPAGVEARFLDPAAPRAWDGSLLYVGRVEARKGIATALAALDRLPGATLTVAGTGPDAARLDHPRVRALGFVAPADLPALYAAHDAVLFPVEWPEPWGLVPLEAMGRGRPVVATGRGGSGEYLEHGVNALLFAAGDAAALAAQVDRLAADPALRERLVAGGRATAARFTAPAVNALVEAALTRAPGAAPAAAPARTIAVVDRETWRAADADVLLFARAPSPALVAAHLDAHRRHPGAAIQGAVRVPRKPFARWWQRRGPVALPPPRAGEVALAHLDLDNASLPRGVLEPFATDLDLARRLAAKGVRLRYDPALAIDAGARVEFTPSAEADARFEAAARRGRARGRLGRALVAWIPERTPWLGPRAWRNATDHYDGALAEAYLHSSRDARRAD